MIDSNLKINKLISLANYFIEKTRLFNEDKKFSKGRIAGSPDEIQKLIYMFDIEYMKLNEGKSLFDFTSEDCQYYATFSGLIIPMLYSIYPYMHKSLSSCKKAFEQDFSIIKLADGIFLKAVKMPREEFDQISRNAVWNKYKETRQIVPRSEIYDYYCQQKTELNKN